MNNLNSKSGQNIQQQGAPGMGAMFETFNANLTKAINKAKDDGVKELVKALAPPRPPEPAAPPAPPLTKEDLSDTVNSAVAKPLQELKQSVENLKDRDKGTPYLERFAKYLFTRKGAVIFFIVVLYLLALCGSFCLCLSAENKAARYENNDLKYRYIRAVGFTNIQLNHRLDSIFDVGDDRSMKRIHDVINNYEQRVKAKSDSIMQAEQHKKDRL